MVALSHPAFAVVGLRAKPAAALSAKQQEAALGKGQELYGKHVGAQTMKIKKVQYAGKDNGKNVHLVTVTGKRGFRGLFRRQDKVQLKVREDGYILEHLPSPSKLGLTLEDENTMTLIGAVVGSAVPFALKAAGVDLGVDIDYTIPAIAMSMSGGGVASRIITNVRKSEKAFKRNVAKQDAEDTLQASQGGKKAKAKSE